MKVARAHPRASTPAARALVSHPRNVTDEMLEWVRRHDGIVMATFVPAFVSAEVRVWDARDRALRAELEAQHGKSDPRVADGVRDWRAANAAPRATLAQVADHVEHIRDVAGVDHVGIGADFDGITKVVEGLEDVSTYPALFAELSRRGWGDEALAKLAGENFLRVLEEIEESARRLQLEGAAT
jgi:membrane dipeptidase